jgi:uncharacterized protein YgiM (DUF1202 family)
MKISYWISLTALISGSALAQPAAVETAPASTNAATPVVPPSLVAPTNDVATVNTNASAEKKPATKPAKKSPAKKPAAKKADAAALVRSEPLLPGPAVVIASNVNVRGQAKYTSEVVTRVTKGDTVLVVEEIQLKNSKPDEPSAWAKIMLPANTHVWAHSQFIDPASKTVTPKKLNVRTGPGENYSIIGSLQKGDTVKDVETKDGWLKIQAPDNAFAFVAAAYLRNAATNAPAEITEPVPPPTEIATTTPIAPPPTDVPTPPSVETTNPPVAPAPEPVEKIEEPPPKRVVLREGIVRGTVSIQAPTHYSLLSPDTGKTINYLHTTSRYLDLSRYKGLRIIVTGEEALDERWPNTPVITIQKIQVLE